MKLVITTTVTDAKEISEWLNRQEGILSREMRAELIENHKLSLQRSPGSITTYEILMEEMIKK